jgi:hypothetical protein
VTGLLAAIEPVTRAASEGGGGLQFPPIENLVLWPAWFAEGTIFEFNKITFISVFATVVTVVLFFTVGRKAKLVPTGLQNLLETSVDFVEKQVIGAAIGAAIGAVAMHFYMKDSTPLKGLGARARPSRGDSNRCVPSLCAQGLTVYCC